MYEEASLRHCPIKRNGIRFRFVLSALCMIGETLNRTFVVVYDVVILSRLKSDDFKDLTKLMDVERKVFFCSFFTGNLLTGALGGRLAERYSAKWTVAISCALVATIHSLTPVLVGSNNLYVIIAGRVAEGMSMGMVSPAFMALIVRWTPPDERFITCALVFSGKHFGGAAGIFVPTWILTNFDYKHVFYFGGVLMWIWLILFLIYIEDFPQYVDSNIMKQSECNYIVSALDDFIYTPFEARHSKIPWRRIFRSSPFFALITINCTVHMIFHIALAIASQTRSEVAAGLTRSTRDPLSQAFLAASPLFWAGIVTIMLGMFHTSLYRHKAINETDGVRVSAVSGLLIPVVCMALDFFAGDELELVAKPLIFITSAGVYNMIQVIHMDLSPNYAAFLIGITNGLGSITGIIIHAVTPSKLLGLSGRQFVAGLYGFCAMTCLIAIFIFNNFLSTDVQEWNFYSDTDKMERSSTAKPKRELVKEESNESLPNIEET